MNTTYLITILIVSLCIATLVKFLIKIAVTRSHSASPNKKKLQLPPGPSPILPFIGSLIVFLKSSNLESHLRELKAKYGPVFAFNFGYRPTVIIANHSTAYRALFQQGTIFSDRPESSPNPLSKIFHSNHHTIVWSSYGPTWRLLRRNLASQMLNPSRLKSYSVDRGWVLGILMKRFQNGREEDQLPVKVYDHFRYGMFSLLVRMCFGDTIPEKKLEYMQSLVSRILEKNSLVFNFSYFPSLVNLILRYQSNEFRQVRKDQEELFIPLIRARINDKRDDMVAYVDTLVDLQLPDEKRKLNEGELVSLCTELINAGTDTTTTTLQWIMAHLVKDQAVQTKLYDEIVKTVGIAPPINMKEEEKKVIEEEELEQMAYLKAVVLEALRIHLPGELVLPHAVSEDVELDGYLVPKKSVVNFMAGSMGRDPEVWEDPMEFKPERFLVYNDPDDKNQSRVEFDLTSSREIKMMPFGAGRRICPGANFAMLHLQYFVANLVWYFEWKQVDEQPVDFTEKKEFTIVMKNPLMAHIKPRAIGV